MNVENIMKEKVGQDANTINFATKGLRHH
jgi:hypothetical protein